MTQDPRYTALVARLPATVPFVTPEAIEARTGRKFEARLGANELCFGPSPKAIEAMCEAAKEVWKYGLCDSEPLRSAIAAHHGIDVDAVLVGEGIDGLLSLVVRMFVADGDCVVTSNGAYPTFGYHVVGFGGRIESVPYADDCEDPVALVDAAARTGAKIVYLVNPDNPMGTWHDKATLRAMIDRIPAHAILVLDEAYCDFMPEDAVMPFDATDKRIIRLRTFSKAYGLAGARIGYAVAHPDLIAKFDAIRDHFGVNLVAQRGALAALQDRDYLAQTLGKIADGRARLAEIARENGLVPLVSATNFVPIDCGRDGAYAQAILKALEARGVFARMPGVAPLDRCIRVSVGTEAEIEVFAERLPLAIADANA